VRYGGAVSIKSGRCESIKGHINNMDMKMDTNMGTNISIRYPIYEPPLQLKE
jgi:hypothetical protein